MKAVLEDVEVLKGDFSFVVYSFSVPFFEFKWHYHPEYELTLIKKGHGKRIVGDSHQYFEKNDLVLLGQRLPHTWFTDSEPHESEAVVIQFSEEFFQRFKTLREFSPVSELINSSQRGIAFKADDDIITMIQHLPVRDGVYRITDFMVILQKLVTAEKTFLSSEAYVISNNTKTQNRINQVCKFVQEHSQEKITIEQMAEMIHVSKSAFCKFFKKVMKTNFSDYLNEIRIANACHWLTSTDKTIKEIALETGFDSLTYFNRIFKKKKKITPTLFREQMNKTL